MGTEEEYVRDVMPRFGPLPKGAAERNGEIARRCISIQRCRARYAREQGGIQDRSSDSDPGERVGLMMERRPSGPRVEGSRSDDIFGHHGEEMPRQFVNWRR